MAAWSWLPTASTTTSAPPGRRRDGPQPRVRRDDHVRADRPGDGGPVRAGSMTTIRPRLRPQHRDEQAADAPAPKTATVSPGRSAARLVPFTTQPAARPWRPARPALLADGVAHLAGVVTCSASARPVDAEGDDVLAVRGPAGAHGPQAPHSGRDRPRRAGRWTRRARPRQRVDPPTNSRPITTPGWPDGREAR